MTGDRLASYLAHMIDAATQARDYVDGMDKAAFLADRRTQHAVILNLIVIGEAATKLLADDSSFANQHPDVRWRDIKGMRNRLAHGYFDIDLEIVWVTVQNALPELLSALERAQTALRDTPTSPSNTFER